MEGLKLLNITVRFLLELCLLAAVGYWGFATQATWPVKLLLGIGLPVLVAVLWGLFVAPKAVYPLTGLAHTVLEVVLLALGAAALFTSNATTLGWVYAVVLLGNEILLIAWKQ